MIIPSRPPAPMMPSIIGIIIMALFAAFVLSGCQELMTPTPLPLITLPPVSPSPEINNSLTTEVPDTVVAKIHQYLGDHNTVTLSQALVITIPEATIAIPANSSITYELTSAGGTITFNAPKPTLTVKLHGIPLHPILDRIVLTTPDKATAHVKEFGTDVVRDFVIPFDSPSPSSAGAPQPSPVPIPTEEPVVVPPRPAQQKKVAVSLPVKLYMWSEPGCIPCKQADTALRSATGLPFFYHKNPNFGPPGGINRYPTFGVLINHKLFTRTGWAGLPDLLAWVERSRKSAPPLTVQELSQYSGTTVGVTGGRVREHLIAVHAFTAEELNGISDKLLLKIHSACHEEKHGG